MTGRAPDSPIEILERWEAHGATWRVLTLTGELAVVELCTCYGEPVEELRSSDPELIRFWPSRAVRSAPAERQIQSLTVSPSGSESSSSRDVSCRAIQSPAPSRPCRAGGR